MINLKFILLIPILEILAFILFGDILGFFPVIFLIFLTFLIGIILLRSNINLKDIQRLIQEPNEWLYQKIAGILLLIPGFITDFLGLVMLVKSFRGYVWKLIIKKKSKNDYSQTNTKTDNIIEAEYKDLDKK
jgi:UPF0716 protein FxsA|tara:strand:- start:3477 stop:3872 length:396 start_codon:yes stop_codon:yes gene_type:complete